ncbi:interferon-induced protein with tetratricopeptide repeats 2-like [Centropristis striata]|uniref:interferon-induced protein with tetratricopeptide repeats 2-like n=1 Tax=Centropristis striata TaxID=184440 RepID=UPI0027E11E16|nr:interferon-induced protein with tetratricopeptide repeats 2-like [Centropristis striata]
MSAAQSQTTLVSKLEALQCHFTWDLDPSRSKLYRLQDKLDNIGTEEGNSWLGHIHNLQGFVEYKMKNIENAQSLFNKAAEAFCQLRNADEGPWLVVNYGNLAWLHHHLEDEAESEAYLSKVDALMNKYPSPSQDELHPEIYAEKVLRNPVSSYNGINPLLRVYRNYLCLDEAIDLIEEALEKHPDECYLKRCAALCYKWKIICKEQRKPKQSVIDRAIYLHKEVISLCPHSSLKQEIDLATIYAKSDYGLDKAEQIYQELLERPDLEPADKQLLYYNYAKYLHFEQHEFESSVRYHMKAAEIPHQSLYRDDSIRVLKKIKDRMHREIQEFLRNLQEPQ